MVDIVGSFFISESRAKKMKGGGYEAPFSQGKYDRDWITWMQQWCRNSSYLKSKYISSGFIFIINFFSYQNEVT